jgi:hypothetical protein
VTGALRQLVTAAARHRGSIALALAGIALLAWLLVSDDLNGLLGGGSG